MANDFYLSAAAKQMEALEIVKSEQLSALRSHRLANDLDGAAECVQSIADTEKAQENLRSLCDSYAASRAAPPELTPEERAAKPWNRMDYRDVWEMSKSKFGPPDENMFRAGIAEAQRRKARGE